jgi:hypothetical protein
MKQNKSTLLFFLILTALTLISCTKQGSVVDPTDTPGTTETQQITFSVDQYNKTVDCSQLKANALKSGKYTAAAFLSLSTKMEFLIYFPSDSSTMASMVQNEKYFAIAKGFYSLVTNEQDYAFAMGFKVPVSNSATVFAYSQEFLDISKNYNQIEQIQYLSSNNDYALFSVKGSYKYQSLNSDSSASKEVSGFYLFHLYTNRK